MPRKRAAKGSPPGQPAARRQRTASASPAADPPRSPSPEPAQSLLPTMPIELKTQIVVDALAYTWNNYCAFGLLCPTWDVCPNDRRNPQLDEILRKLRVDVYTPSKEALKLEEWPVPGEPVPYLGEIESHFAGHSMRRVQCPLFNEGKHGFDNRKCQECGCGPYKYDIYQEDLAAWDWEYPGKVDPFRGGAAGGQREIEGGGAWAGRLRKDKGYKMTNEKKAREKKRWPLERFDRRRTISKKYGFHGYLNNIRHTDHGKYLIREVKRTRAVQPDRLVHLGQRPVKRFGSLDVRGLAGRIAFGHEGVLSWGDEMLDLLPFIPGWTDRYDEYGDLRETHGTPPPTAAESAIQMAPYVQVKKHLAPESPGQETWFEYKHIRHLMISAYPPFHYSRRRGPADIIRRFGNLPRGPLPARRSVMDYSWGAILERLTMECNVPLYVDYLAMTSLETLYLDLTNVMRADHDANDTLYVREVLGLARRLEGKNLRLLVIAGLRTGAFTWPGERDWPEERLGPFTPDLERWEDVNWMYEFRKAVRPGGKVILVDANNEYFPGRRFDQWYNPDEDYPRHPPLIFPGPEGEVMEMGGYPLFLNNTIDNVSDVEADSPMVDEGEFPEGWEVFEEEMPVPMLEVEVPAPIPQEEVHEVHISDTDEEVREAQIPDSEESA